VGVAGPGCLRVFGPIKGIYGAFLEDICGKGRVPFPLRESRQWPVEEGGTQPELEGEQQDSHFKSTDE
jgi:hypothetical protein